MTVKTVNLDEELITAAERRARELTKEYGVTVSFSEVVRRALAAFLLPIQSTSSSKVYQEIGTPPPSPSTSSIERPLR